MFGARGQQFLATALDTGQSGQRRLLHSGRRLGPRRLLEGLRGGRRVDRLAFEQFLDGEKLNPGIFLAPAWRIIRSTLSSGMYSRRILRLSP